MEKEVKITFEAKITVEGLNYSHFKANKSTIPSLRKNRQKKYLKDEEESYQYYLERKERQIARSISILKSARDFIKKGVVSPDISIFMKSTTTKYEYADRHNLSRDILSSPGGLYYYPLEGRKITKNTTDKEIEKMVLESEKEYEQETFLNVIASYKEDLNTPENEDYYLWLCPDPRYSISVDSDDCPNTKKLYDLLKAKKTLDVVFHVENDCNSFIAKRVDIRKEY